LDPRVVEIVVVPLPLMAPEMVIVWLPVRNAGAAVILLHGNEVSQEGFATGARVVMLVEPGQVERAVFSTLLRPTSDFVRVVLVIVLLAPQVSI
jgi:hypothetical protein